MRQSDEELVTEAQAGNRPAFEELVGRYSDRVYAGAFRMVRRREDAEEVTQETFLRAWRSIGRFQGRSGFFTWLYRIGINESKRRIEARASRAAASLDSGNVEEPRAPWTESPERQAGNAELRETLERAIAELPLDYRAPLVLRDVEGRSIAEAAEMMELSVPAFKSRLHRARVAVRDMLAPLLEERS